MEGRPGGDSSFYIPVEEYASQLLEMMTLDFVRPARQQFCIDLRGDLHPVPNQWVARAADGLLPLVVEKALALGAEVHDISVRTPTLETVFISLTGRNLRE